MIEAWTDYPFVSLGDIPYEEAPIRKVRINAFDGSLYCEIEVEKKTEWIKSGYLYTEEGRLGTAPKVPFDKLAKLPRIDQ
jgi:hypothetical protein